MRKKLQLSLLMISLVGLIFLSYGVLNDHSRYMRLAEGIGRYTNDLAQRPLMGWSSWSALGSFPTESKIQTQAQVLARTLKSHGYMYVNLDDYWYLDPATTVDQFGRWVADPQKFPGGIASLSAYVHGLGLKFGIYLNPGIPVAAVQQNTPIEGTKYHARDIADTSKYETSFSFGKNDQYVIDYSKPGAQAFINSWTHLLAQWNIDFLKLDGVQSRNSIQSQVSSTIRAWSLALKQLARPIYFDLSGAFTLAQASLLRVSANGWRIDDDIECYASCAGRVSWQHVMMRFKDVPLWARWAGPGGWNDLDSLDVGNGGKDGLTDDERQSYMTLWAISAAPLYIGDDLTTLDEYGLNLLTNDEVININQQGVVVSPITTTTQQQVWRAKEADGSYVVALFNLGDSPATVSVNWSALGLKWPALVRDLWSHINLGVFGDGFSAKLNLHASRLLKLMPISTSSGS